MARQTKNKRAKRGIIKKTKSIPNKRLLEKIFPIAKNIRNAREKAARMTKPFKKACKILRMPEKNAGLKRKEFNICGASRKNCGYMMRLDNTSRKDTTNNMKPNSFGCFNNLSVRFRRSFRIFSSFSVVKDLSSVFSILPNALGASIMLTPRAKPVTPDITLTICKSSISFIWPPPCLTARGFAASSNIFQISYSRILFYLTTLLLRKQKSETLQPAAKTQSADSFSVVKQSPGHHFLYFRPAENFGFNYLLFIFRHRGRRQTFGLINVYRLC